MACKLGLGNSAAARDGGGKASWPSTTSESKSSIKKRNASAADMDPSDMDTATEQPENYAALQVKLIQLQTAISNIPLSWEPCAPQYFMADITRWGDPITKLTIKTVEAYMKLGFSRDVLYGLQIHEIALRKPITGGDSELTKVIREEMIKYVEGVQSSLNGQS
jgi:hypothetical protein